MLKIVNICNKIIIYSFYSLFALVPLIFTPLNFELFEFNKMWVIYILTIVVMATWLVKMILQGEIKIKGTPLDVPILLFLGALVASTIFSIDVHTSIWGYYSRFNGGLLSIIAYILLYWAFVNNLNKKEEVLKVFHISLVTGALIAFYAVLERFGIDAQYWVQDVRNRVFSTLGQPNWLAAYLSILIPIAIAFGISNSKNKQSLRPSGLQKSKIQSKYQKFLISNMYICYFIFAILYYVALLYTKSRSGFLGLGIGLLFFCAVYFWHQRQTLKNIALKKFISLHKYLLVVLAMLGVVTFVVGTPFEQINKFTLPNLQPTTYNLQPTSPALETGGTESGEIRRIVWQGAVDIARNYSLFGSGLETFAYSYYRFRPAEHNLTSEWDFLYNKAHNEYLNYLATTGLVGLATYLLMIGAFFIVCIKYYVSSINKKIPNTYYLILTTSLLASYISILISNFFGFSVVVINLYFFLIPAMVFTFAGQLDTKKTFVFTMLENVPKKNLSMLQLVNIAAIILIAYYLLLHLALFWLADRDYAKGYNLDRAGQFEEGYQHLHAAITKRSDEPVFKDELAVNAAILATAFYSQGEATVSAALTDQAVALSNDVIKAHPNNVTFFKNQARIFYTLTSLDEKYLFEAVKALERAKLLAPTDAKISYNLALLYGQAGDTKKAIEMLEQTIRLKSDYRDAYYALGIFYDEGGQRKKAIEAVDYIIKNIATQDAEATQLLLEWRGY